MTDLNKYEVAAMWHYRTEYAQQAKGAVAFWRDLSASKKRTVIEMIEEITAAPWPWPDSDSVVAAPPEGATP